MRVFSKTVSQSLLIHILVGLLVCVLTLVYILGVVRQYKAQNYDLTLADQGAYLNNSEALFTNWIGDMNRMPLYPTLLRLVYQSNTNQEVFFERAVILNITVSLLALAGIAVLFYTFLGSGAAAIATLMTAFGVFMFKAPYVQVEILFYFFSFLTFLLYVRALQKPSLSIVFFATLSTALTAYTKASFWGGWSLFLIFLLLQAGVYAKRTSVVAWTKTFFSSLYFKMFLVSIITFTLLFSPYMYSTYKKTGKVFYNVATSFVVWYDSWEEALDGTIAHGDSYQWPDMPQEDIPSLGWYLRSHSLTDIFSRLTTGLLTMYGYVVTSYGYFKYLYGVVVVLAVVVLSDLERAERLFLKHSVPILFVASYFMLHWLAFGWYAAIVADDRLNLMLFLPFLFSSFWIISQLLPKWVTQKWSPQFVFLCIFAVVLLDSLLLQLPKAGALFGGY